MSAIRQFKAGPLYVMWGLHRGGWFRLFGRGLAVTNHDDCPPLFSERYNGQNGRPKRLYIHVGSWCIKPLRRL